jgi:hypothetical protein
MKNGTRIFADERGSGIGVNKSGLGEKLNIQAVVFQKRPGSHERAAHKRARQKDGSIIPLACACEAKAPLSDRKGKNSHEASWHACAGR